MKAMTKILHLLKNLFQTTLNGLKNTSEEKQTGKPSFSRMLPMMVLFAFLFSQFIFGQTTTYTSGSVHFTVQANLTSIKVQVWCPGCVAGG